MKKMKLVALDMDGTTLDSDRKISEYTKEVIEKSIESGVIVMAATGRPQYSVPEQFLKLKGVRYLITCNGARIVDLKTNDIMYEQMLNKDDVLEMIQIARKYDAYYEAIISGVGYTTKEMLDNVVKYGWLENMASYLKKTRKIVDSIENTVNEAVLGIDKFQVVITDKVKREEALAEFRRLGAYEMDSAFERNIEITAPKVNKGNGLETIAKRLNIPMEQTMAIGDGMNDYSMVKVAGVGVAMENAVEELKTIADYITDTNDKDGVAKAIARFC